MSRCFCWLRKCHACTTHAGSLLGSMNYISKLCGGMRTCVYVCQSFCVCLSLSLSLCLYLSVCPSLSLLVCLSLSLSLCLSLSLSLSVVCLPVCLSVFLSASLSLCLIDALTFQCTPSRTFNLGDN